MPSFWAKNIVNACHFDPKALPMPFFWPEGIVNAILFTLNGKFSLIIGMIMPLGWGEVIGIIPKLVTQGPFGSPLVTCGFATCDSWGIQMGFRDLWIIFSFPGLSQAGGPGGQVPPHFLADQLTLSQPGGAHYPHPVVRATPDFQTLRRPCFHSCTL
jgi:hypothetical protein